MGTEEENHGGGGHDPGGTPTSVIMRPRVLLRSRYVARFCCCCNTRSRQVRYSSANSRSVWQNCMMRTSRAASAVYPRYSRKAWNLGTFWRGEGQCVYLGLKGWRWQSGLWPKPSPVAHTAVHNPQHGNTAGTVGQEVGEAGTQGWSQLVLGQAPQALLCCPAPALQLPQVLSQLLKVHLEKQGVHRLSPHRKTLPQAASVCAGPCPPKAYRLMQEIVKSTRCSGEQRRLLGISGS